MRQTSIDAYNVIRNNGLLSRRRMQVYSYFFENGPCSMKDMTTALAKPTENTSGYDARVTELKKFGVLTEVGHQKCKYSGQMVIKWDVTDKLPIKYDEPKKATRKELVQEIIKLNEIIADLRSQK